MARGHQSRRNCPAPARDPHSRSLEAGGDFQDRFRGHPDRARARGNGGAYWIEPYGAPVGPREQPDNTLYIAGHSWTRGAAAFNALMAGAGVRVGDVVYLSGCVFTARDGVYGYMLGEGHEPPIDIRNAYNVTMQSSPGKVALATASAAAAGRGKADWRQAPRRTGAGLQGLLPVHRTGTAHAAPSHPGDQPR